MECKAVWMWSEMESKIFRVVYAEWNETNSTGVLRELNSYNIWFSSLEFDIEINECFLLKKKL
jgi:hypothetical protein